MTSVTKDSEARKRRGLKMANPACGRGGARSLHEKAFCDISQYRNSKLFENYNAGEERAVEMPKLFYVPMIHTPAEFGSLKEAVLAIQVKAYGAKRSHEHLKDVERYWQEVEQRIQLAGFDRPEVAARLHIFVDGLPDVQESLMKKIVEELISQQIPVYRIIKMLLEKGAKIYGTEDPKLLLEERRYWIEVSQGKMHDPSKAQELLQNRDRYISERISSVVPGDGCALLFIGRNHDVVSALERLPRNFTIIYL